MTHRISRRQALAGLAAGGATVAAAAFLAHLHAADETTAPKLKGRVHHSVCRWCYGKIPLDELCTAAKAMGIASIDLLGPDEWATAAKHGLTCAMVSVPGTTIARGFNRVEHHDKLIESYEAVIPKAAEAGLKNVICLSGNREGLDDEQGMKNCAAGVKRLLPLAEQKKITLVMELLNSKVDHKDYQCDRTAWGIELCKQVGSERFKLLYDIYHMQIMEGDLISTIKQAAAYIAHYHTGGVPGRAEIDQTQEINYPAVVRAIVDTGYQGFIAQEFIPRGPDPLASLREAVAICDV
jgi:hydroxypyruvate isomerase